MPISEGVQSMDKVVQIKLSEPLTTLGGITLTELTADFGKIKTRDLSLINRVSRRLKGGEDFDFGNLSKAADAEFRIAVTWVAVLKSTNGVSLDDIDSLSIADCLEMGNYSLPFLVKISSAS